MPSISDGIRFRRASLRSVSRRLRPQSTSRRVPPASATRQLPWLPLPSEAKRSNGYFSCSCSRARMRCAVREPSVPPSLLSTLTRLPSGSCFTSTRKCSALVLESSALNSREKKPRSRSFLAIAAFFELRAGLQRRPTAGGELLRLFLLRAEPHHHAAQEFGFEARVGLARLPHRLAGRSGHVARRGVDLLHAAVADIDLGAFAVGSAVEPRAKLVALGGGIDLVDKLTQQRADSSLGDIGAVLRPVGFHHAGLGRFGLDQKAVLLPEVLHQRPELLGNLVLHHQPALGAGALDVHPLDLRQHRRVAGARLLLALDLVARKRGRGFAGLGHDEAGIARRRGEIGRYFEVRQRARRLVVDLAVEEAGAAAGKQRYRAGNCDFPHPARPSTTRSPGSAMPA